MMKKEMRYIQMILLILFLAGGICLGRYMNSEPYLYRKNMEQAEKCFAEEKWSEAYQAYCAALECNAEDKDAERGMLLSLLEIAKEDGNTESIIWEYENLFSRQSLFVDEMDISDWYFECADYYLKKDDPKGALELLGRGMKTFEKTDILQRMQEKKEYILAHCQVKAEICYTDGKRSGYTEYEYDEKGRNILEVSYYGEKNTWIYREYDEADHQIYVGVWEKEGDGEKQKQLETYWTYDKRGNLLHYVTCDLREEKTQESNYAYDEKGNQTYYKETYGGELVDEEECFIISDTLQIAREYDTYHAKTGAEYYYVERKLDHNGALLEEAYYPDTYTIEEILSGEAYEKSRRFYTYDERGNCVACHYDFPEENEESYLLYEIEYDDRNNRTKEVYNNRVLNRDGTISFCTDMTIWQYNEKNQPVKKEMRNESKDYDNESTGIWERTDLYTYDEAGNLIRTDRLNGDEIEYSDIEEYDLLGNKMAEYRLAGGGEMEKPSKEWEYQYRYMRQ